MDIEFFKDLIETTKIQLLIWQQRNKDEISWHSTDNAIFKEHKVITIGFNDFSKYYFKVKK